MFVGKVSSLTLLFKSAYFAWEYILLKIGKNSFREVSSQKLAHN